jgi:hypothetical protein
MIQARTVGLLMAIVLFFLNNAECAWYVIRQNDILGLQETKETNIDWESEMMQILASMKLYDTARPFQCDLQVYNRYYLRDIPEIRVYVLSTCTPPATADTKDFAEYYYSYVFYNIERHRIYYFGAGESVFATVFGPYLSKHYNKPEIVDLLWLYLNSTSPTERAYYILADSSSIDSLYNRFGVLDSSNIFYSYDEYIEDRKQIIGAIQPLQFENSPEYSEIGFYTWEWRKGTIEYFRFRLTESSVEKIEWKKILTGIGPKRP